MRKLLYISAVIVAVAFIGCSKDDSDSEQQQPKAVCHFDDFRRANGNPQITYGTTADGKRCRQIEYDCLKDTIQSHGPAHLGGGTILLKLLTNFKEDEIIIFEIHTDKQKDSWEAQAIDLRKWTLVFDTGDTMYFDYSVEVNGPSGEVEIIKTKFQCVHL